MRLAETRLRGFWEGSGSVEAVDERVFEPDVAEVAEDDDCGKADERDEEHGGLVRQKMNDETGDEFKHEDVSEVDGVGPVADGGEEGEIVDDAGAFELDGAEEEESGEGAVEEGAAPGPVGDPFRLQGMEVCGADDDRGEPEERTDEENMPAEG